MRQVDKFPSREAAEKAGFAVDCTCYPWVAYKGPRFNPEVWGHVRTDTESQLSVLVDTLQQGLDNCQSVRTVQEREINEYHEKLQTERNKFSDEVAELERQLDWMNEERREAQKHLGLRPDLWEHALNEYDRREAQNFAAALPDIKMEHPSKVGGAIFGPGVSVYTVVASAIQHYSETRKRHAQDEEGQELDEGYLHPHFLHKIPIPVQLRAIAAQEGADGDDYNLMVAAANYCDKLSLKLGEAEDATKLAEDERRWQAKKFSNDLADRNALLRKAAGALHFASDRIGFTTVEASTEWKGKVEDVLDGIEKAVK